VTSTDLVKDPAAARAELDRLQQELADRRSISHFAQAGIGLVVAMILASAAAKLFWDSAKTPYLGIVAAIGAVALATYSVVQYVKGKRHLESELSRFEALKSLQRALHLDDPSALLPQ
jgi:uncharacterized membrane protein YebE (DUF533 family)